MLQPPTKKVSSPPSKLSPPNRSRVGSFNRSFVSAQGSNKILSNQSHNNEGPTTRKNIFHHSPDLRASPIIESNRNFEKKIIPNHLKERSLELPTITLHRKAVEVQGASGFKRGSVMVNKSAQPRNSDHPGYRNHTISSRDEQRKFDKDSKPKRLSRFEASHLVNKSHDEGEVLR